MGLKRAANFFARTPIYGLVGSSFTDTGCTGALQPFDRFVSEREFGSKRRMLLVDPDNPIPEDITVIKIGSTGPIYLLGWMNRDIEHDDAYSFVYLIHMANEVTQLISLTKQVKASGMAGAVVDTIVGTWHCNSERITFNNSREFNEIRITDSTVTLPSDCPVTVDHELVIDSRRYVVQEVYNTSGLLQVRSQLKYPTP